MEALVVIKVPYTSLWDIYKTLYYDTGNWLEDGPIVFFCPYFYSCCEDYYLKRSKGIYKGLVSVLWLTMPLFVWKYFVYMVTWLSYRIDELFMILAILFVIYYTYWPIAYLGGWVCFIINGVIAWRNSPKITKVKINERLCSLYTIRSSLSNIPIRCLKGSLINTIIPDGLPVQQSCVILDEPNKQPSINNYILRIGRRTYQNPRLLVGRNVKGGFKISYYSLNRDSGWSDDFELSSSNITYLLTQI